MICQFNLFYWINDYLKLVIVKVRACTVQPFSKFQKSPGGILTLNYIAKRIQVIFRCGFKVIFSYLVSGSKSPPDFCYFLWKLCQIKSFLVYFENFHFLWFFHLWPIFAKNWKNEKFKNWNMTFYGLKWLYLA